jgi:hypothetical protein
MLRSHLASWRNTGREVVKRFVDAGTALTRFRPALDYARRPVVRSKRQEMGRRGRQVCGRLSAGLPAGVGVRAAVHRSVVFAGQGRVGFAGGAGR